MSIRQLASALDLSVGQTFNLRKRGMPADPAAARAWRSANIIGPRTKVRTKLPELSRDLSAVKKHATSLPTAPDTLEQAEKIFAELSAACETAQLRAEQLTGSPEAAVDELGRRWSLVAADLLARKLTVVEKVQALRVQSAELVPYAEVRDQFVRFLQDVRRLAESMPAAVAMRANPSDPLLAQTALEEWLEAYFRLLNSSADIREAAATV